MKIENISLYNYRNYDKLSLELSPNINIFTGYNAQGKTNIIESIHFSALGISHRTRNEGDLIKWHENQAQININFSKLNIKSNLKFLLKNNTRKQIIYNSEQIKQKELPGLLTMILFSPEDLMLIKGTPLLRRRFLDIELSQVSLIYYNELVKYNKILLQRNNLLKKIKENHKLIDMLDMWDEQFARGAAFIVEKRILGVNKLSEITKSTHKNISRNNEILDLKYNISNINNMEINTSDLYSIYLKELKNNRNKDIYRGSTSIGPHRDDLNFYINDVELKSFGSQGQQRSSILSLKLAELEFLKDETGEYPVLLLDDVMSELDKNRRDNLLEILQDKNIQTLITATDKDLFNNHPKNNFYKVVGGVVSIE